jgi:hypothetical protein
LHGRNIDGPAQRARIAALYVEGVMNRSPMMATRVGRGSWLIRIPCGPRASFPYFLRTPHGRRGLGRC